VSANYDIPIEKERAGVLRGLKLLKDELTLQAEARQVLRATGGTSSFFGGATWGLAPTLWPSPSVRLRKVCDFDLKFWTSRSPRWTIRSRRSKLALSPGLGSGRVGSGAVSLALVR
jgi:hypothetical protein